MKLAIDSSDNHQLKIKIGEQEKKIPIDNPRNQDILAEIHNFLEEQQVKLSQLTEIEVNQGPGKFTSLRVGIAVAQALAFSLNIPINGKPAGTSIDAHYGKAPNITVSKKTT